LRSRDEAIETALETALDGESDLNIMQAVKSILVNKKVAEEKKKSADKKAGKKGRPVSQNTEPVTATIVSQNTEPLPQQHFIPRATIQQTKL